MPFSKIAPLDGRKIVPANLDWTKLPLYQGTMDDGVRLPSANPFFLHRGNQKCYPPGSTALLWLLMGRTCFVHDLLVLVRCGSNGVSACFRVQALCMHAGINQSSTFKTRRNGHTVTDAHVMMLLGGQTIYTNQRTWVIHRAGAWLVVFLANTNTNNTIQIQILYSK
jgi:hypothetical protein